MKPKMKVFISLPMAGKDDERVKTEMKMLAQIAQWEYPDREIEVIDSFLECDEGPVWCLGESIKLIQGADLVVFHPHWKGARGCRIERQVCEEYGIKALEV